MVQQIFAFSSIGAGVRIDLDSADGEDAFVADNAVIGSEDDVAIFGSGSGHRVNVQGTVVGTDAAIELGNNFDDSGQDVLIGVGAYLTTTSLNFAAVVIRGDGSAVDNRGTISSPALGVVVGGNGPANITVLNSGLIEGTSAAVSRFASSTETIVLDNTGEIRSPAFAYRSAGPASAKDLITNSGLMDGNLLLAFGDDRYDGRLGRVVGEVAGGDGADLLLGGAFSDDFIGEAGGDILDGGGGDDELEGGAGADALAGGAGNDTLLGNEDNDSLLGGDGDDFLDGDAGADSVSGGAGNDALYGGSGADAMSGGAGNDWYDVDDVGDVVSEAGGSGIDLVESSISFDLSSTTKAIGAIESLTLTGSANIIGAGNALANEIVGNAGDNILDGLTGNDRLNGGTGADTLHGGAGNDALDGGSGSDMIFGDVGNDALSGGSGADSMSGGIGNDRYEVENSGDVVSEGGASGIDLVVSLISFSLYSEQKAIGAIENLTLAGSANISGTGNALANLIVGNAGNNILDGFTGKDRLIAGAGADTLRGGQGNDMLVGGAAKDAFVFNTAPNTATNRDIVADFVHGLDKLHLENAIFAKLGAAGALKAANFRVGAAALDADDFIVYNKATGVLSYDINGNAAGGAVQFAVLTTKPTLTASDFLVI